MRSIRDPKTPLPVGAGSPPGPIDNSDLLSDGESALRADAVEHEDFLLVPQHAWEYLHSRHGALGPSHVMERHVVEEGDFGHVMLRVEIRPVLVHVRAPARARPWRPGRRALPTASSDLPPGPHHPPRCAAYAPLRPRGPQAYLATHDDAPLDSNPMGVLPFSRSSALGDVLAEVQRRAEERHVHGAARHSRAWFREGATGAWSPLDPLLRLDQVRPLRCGRPPALMRCTSFICPVSAPRALQIPLTSRVCVLLELPRPDKWWPTDRQWFADTRPWRSALSVGSQVDAQDSHGSWAEGVVVEELCLAQVRV